MLIKIYLFDKLIFVLVEFERPVIISSLRKKAKALYDFDAIQSNQLSFKEGDVITILDQDGSGWIKVF